MHELAHIRRLDLWVANLDLETNNLYVALPVSGRVPRWRDVVHAAGLAEPTLQTRPSTDISLAWT